MNSNYVRFTYVLLTCWFLGLFYIVFWFFTLDRDPGLPEIFANAHFTWTVQPAPRGGPEPRLDGLVRGTKGTQIMLPPMPPARETDIVRHSDVKKQSEIRTCFWPGPRSRIGVYTTDPDDYAHDALGSDWGRTSSLSWFKLPAGANLVLKGHYPHARLMTLVIYDENGRVADSLYDAAIDPNVNSENPFRRGTRRDVTTRDYTVTIVNGKPPSGKRPFNTLFTQSEAGSNMAINLSIYVPDQQRDWTGGVGLPQIELKLADERVLDEKDACEQSQSNLRGQALPTHGWWPRFWLALNQLPWKETSRSPAEDFDVTGMRRFYNTEFSMAQAYVPFLEFFQEYLPVAFRPDVRDPAWSDPYTRFGYAEISQVFGKVFVVQGRLPTTPRTWDQPTNPMSDSTEMRYWSLCTSSFPITGLTTDCVHDENLRTLLDTQGQFNVVVSRLADRPNNATERCGVQWLEWGHGDGVPGGARGYGALINRYTLVDPEFKRGWGDVESPSRERQTLGPNRPFVLNLTDKERFELLGCPVSGVVLDRLRTGKDRSWRRR